jgi:hypothetical protein
MNPKAKLALVIGIPLLGIALWVFSLFALLSPADVSWPDAVWTISWVNQTGNTVQLPAWNTQTQFATGSKTWAIAKPTVVRVLKVAIPIWMYNEPGRRPITNKLAQQNIQLVFISNKRTQSYDEFVQTLLMSGATGADIILLNNDQLDAYSEYAGSFWFSEDISSLFPYLFFDYLKRTDVTFVPFGIDPLVTFAKQALTENVQSIDRSDIVNNSVSDLDERKIAVQIPILFGLSNLDLQLIKNKKEIYEGYTDILKNVVYQSVNNSQLLDILKSYSNDMLEVKIRDLAKYKRVLGKLIDRDPRCGPHPKLCFMHYGLTNFAFGNLSELDTLKGYFEKSDYGL